jgi:NAD(P)-dependent dehydrogenase (short-subunit alcohol dehydrogenase family)
MISIDAPLFARIFPARPATLVCACGLLRDGVPVTTGSIGQYPEQRMNGWTNEVAMVTGSSRGIGRAIAKTLAARGAAVCINYATSAREAEAAASEIAATGGRAIALQADVADADAVTRMVARATAELGPVSILVNNAGISTPATLKSYDPASIARMRKVNVDGVIHTIRAVAPRMKERAHGRIVNIASNAAIGTALPGTTFYAATKAEVLILTRRFAMELGRNGITVNAVAPGWIVTEMARAGRSQQEFEARVRDMSERTMVGRTGLPDDIANAVAFLAAPESGFVTAQVLTVDGGRMDYIGHG